MDFQAVLIQVETWPEEDRLRLIEAVWSGLTGAADEPGPSEELKALLDRRVEALDRNPDAVIAWEVVEARALERFRK